MKLGTKHYYSKNQVLDLLNSPINGDASMVLAKTLITAKFNVAQGSEFSPIVLTINAAMNLIGDKRLPYDNPVSFSSSTGIQMLNLAVTLNSYNSGNLNIATCSGIVPAITRIDLKNEIKAAPGSLSIFPNPTSSSTTISFSLAQREKVSIKLFDVSGKLVKTIIENVMSGGNHQIRWMINLKEDFINSGIYFVKLTAGNNSETSKLIIAR
ncbi:MAG TPA: T9SS type A sorting domain-containing protein [Chitinophagaceae bacterium]|nr:T9SS type A sorting domain-containing protein [Chitinophagaceae bacterium]